MPGVVPLAVVEPAIVLPLSLCTAFERIPAYESLTNTYANGERQSGILVTNSRLRWRLSKRLKPEKLVELRDFWEVVRTSDPFYFYDPYLDGDSGPIVPVGGNHDPSGFNQVGRFVVRFDSHWSQTMNIARGEVSFELVELAEGFASGFVPAAMG